MFLNQSEPEAEVWLTPILLHLFDTWDEVQPHGSTALTERFSQQDIGDILWPCPRKGQSTDQCWGTSGLSQKDRKQLVLLDRARLIDFYES